MGYTTEFVGAIKVVPPLNAEEIAYLRKFSETRRMHRKKGPYFVGGKGFMGQGDDPDIIDSNSSGDQPSLWCQWVPDGTGQYIEWNGGEKFYESAHWMQYIIDHFIGSDPKAKGELPFLQGHTCSGTIKAQGEDLTDRWKLIVKNNKVTKKDLE